MRRIKTTIFLLVTLYLVFAFSNISAQSHGAETAFLHIDKTTYIAGEPINYKLYVLDAKSKKLSNQSSIAYIQLTSDSLNIHSRKITKLVNGMSSGSFVLPDSLTSGVYKISAFTNVMKNFGSNYFFQKDIVVVNRFDKNLKFKPLKISNKIQDNSFESEHIISTSKTLIGLREKVTVELKNSGNAEHLSISVFEDSPLNQNYSSIKDIVTQNNFEPNYKQTKKYLPEKYGKILAGSVLDTKSLQGIANKIVLLSCPDSIANLKYATTNSEGRFYFTIGDYYNEKVLFLTLKEINEQYKLVVDDDFIKTPASVVTDSSTTFVQNEYLVKCQNIFQINKSYRLANDTIRVANSSKTGFYAPKVYYNKAITIYPKDFVSLNNFSEISVELLPQVRILTVDSKYKLQILGASAYKVQNTDPAIFLDGVFVDDINKIMNIGSDKIKKIELQNVERVIGDISFPGVMAISTFTNEILSSIPASYSCSFKNNNFEVNKRFFEVNTNYINDAKMPYVKQLLYWKPDITTQKNQNFVFDFYTSDNTGSFIINIEGVSENGTPISDRYRIKVDNLTNSSQK